MEAMRCWSQSLAASETGMSLDVKEYHICVKPEDWRRASTIPVSCIFDTQIPDHDQPCLHDHVQDAQWLEMFAILWRYTALATTLSLKSCSRVQLASEPRVYCL